MALAGTMAGGLGPLAPYAIPPLGFLAGMVTGSNVGAASSLMPVQAGLGLATGLPPWLAPGLHNFAGSVGAIFPSLTATPVRAATCALVALWTCTLVNLVGLRQAGRLQVLVTALKLLPLLLFGIVALWFVDAGRLRDALA